MDPKLLQTFKDNLALILKEPDTQDPSAKSMVMRSIKEYRRTYDAVLRDEAREILQANQSAVQQQVEAKRHRCEGVPRNDIIPKETAPKSSEAEQVASRFLNKASGKVMDKFYAPAIKISAGEVLPKCTAWTVSRQCSKACDTTKRMFYTDDDGETIPATEDDEDRAMEFGLEGIFGRHQQRDEWILQSLFVHYSFHPQALRAMVDVFKWQWSWLVRYISEKPLLLEMLLRQRLHELDVKEGRTADDASPVLSADAEGTSSDAQVNGVTSRLNGLVPPCNLPALPRRPEPASTSPSTSTPEGAHEAGWDLVKTCTQMYCQFCKVYNCRRHGSHQKIHEKRPTPISKHDATYQDVTGSSCSEHCYRTMPATDSAPPATWTKAEEDMLMQGLAVFRDNPCNLALFIGTKTCSQVHARLQKLHANPTQCDVAGLPLSAAPVRRKRTKFNDKATLVAKRAPAIATRLKHDPRTLWPEYKPCECEGEAGCNANCSCALSKNFCEKYCKCGGKCVNVTKGCVCTTSCSINSCPCLASGRECDPDKCRGCTATALGTLKPGDRVCQNMNLRMGVRRQVAMGLSEVAGWGCFILEDTKQHDFIGEYTGDLVTQVEAERRGKVYDINDSSYLFSLNETWAIDAQKHGNKLRYANHSQQMNAYARILMVDGDHRVGIFANKDLKAGVEIFYDYGYDDCYCPDWGQEKHPAARRGEGSRRKGLPIKRTNPET